jgi:hypothetical protein
MMTKVKNSELENGLISDCPELPRKHCDINGDGVVDQLDLAYAQFYFMVQVGDARWNDAKIADVNGDGVVDIVDLTEILANIT